MKNSPSQKIPINFSTTDAPELNMEENEADLHELGIYDQKRAEELLRSVAHIMSICVDIGWGVDIVQLMLPELFRKSANDNEKQKGDAHD